MEFSDIEVIEEPVKKAPRPSRSIVPVEEDKVVEVVNKVRKKRARRDTKILIRAIMETPLRKGEVAEVDGSVPIEVLSKQNTDVQTRMLLKIAGQAANGDIKAADFLMKYGGYTPPVEQNVTLNLPKIVDDIKDLDDEDDEE